MFSTELLDIHLNTEFLGSKINYLSETNSTNIDAWNHIDDGSEEGAIFITDNQKKGRGRRQNNWVSIPYKSLTVSFILYPKIGLDKLGLLPILTGVSIVQGIKSSTSIQTGLKWPNDIMLNMKKLGGILIESKTSQNGLGVVVGIGLNINETTHDIPNLLKDQATSLLIYSGASYSREKILSEILNEFERLYVQKWDSMVHIWGEYCIHRKSEVSFHAEEGLHQGVFQGISSLGHAEIQINGKTQTFPSGIVML
jgi:BirA family biotin operon repressor/biotin-[acetyl-CoA-carboxylase] ligase